MSSFDGGPLPKPLHPETTSLPPHLFAEHGQLLPRTAVQQTVEDNGVWLDAWNRAGKLNSCSNNLSQMLVQKCSVSTKSTRINTKNETASMGTQLCSATIFAPKSPCFWVTEVFHVYPLLRHTKYVAMVPVYQNCQGISSPWKANSSHHNTTQRLGNTAATWTS